MAMIAFSTRSVQKVIAAAQANSRTKYISRPTSDFGFRRDPLGEWLLWGDDNEQAVQA
jgi:hypothetical protein